MPILECHALEKRYGSAMALDHIDLALEPGRITGLLGPNGSGKSTLLKLLMRFWDVQEGSVSISGTGVNQINTSNLRDMESFVTQETCLFHDSVAANLRIAKLDATQEELEALEVEMKKIAKEDIPIERFELPRAEAIKYMEEREPGTFWM